MDEGSPVGCGALRGGRQGTNGGPGFALGAGSEGHSPNGAVPCQGAYVASMSHTHPDQEYVLHHQRRANHAVLANSGVRFQSVAAQVWRREP